MAATPSSSSSSAHVRSTSWPQDVYPLSRAIESHLLILTQKPESSCRKLGVLKNLYEVVEVFLHLQTKKTPKAVLEDVCEGLIEVLDICNTIRDVLMQIKEQVRELESSLRKVIRSKSRSDREGLLARGIDSYVSKRRSLSRTVCKESKKNKKKGDCGDNNIHVMKKVEETSFNVLVSLLVEVVTMNLVDYEKRSKRGIVSKIFNWKKQEVDAEELKKLREAEQKIEETERDLECVYKKLLKTRVSLLNTLTL